MRENVTHFLQILGVKASKMSSKKCNPSLFWMIGHRLVQICPKSLLGPLERSELRTSVFPEVTKF